MHVSHFICGGQSDLHQLGISSRRSPSPPAHCSREFINQEQFHASLAVDILSLAQDIENVLRQRDGIEHSCPGQGAWLFQSRQFQQWAVSRKSGSLLVDGNADGFELERMSPMSTCCAALMRSFESMRPGGAPLSLSFFCGLHAACNDELFGPRGLMRSLIAQILTNYSFRLGFVDSHNYRAALENHDLDHLCAAFKRLIYQLPAHFVVFCVVDGISLFERDDLQGELNSVASSFRVLCEDPALGCFFKLLITSPAQSRFVKLFFPPETYLTIPPECCDGQDVRVEDVIANARSGSLYSPSSSASSSVEVDLYSDGSEESEDGDEDG